LETATFVAGLRLQGIVAPLVFDGPINAQVFEAYVDQFLVPTLRSGDVVIMDNLSSHKGAKVRERIEAAGARLLYLPPYSPDFNRVGGTAATFPSRYWASPVILPWSRIASARATRSAMSTARLPFAAGTACVCRRPSRSITSQAASAERKKGP
jgi:hypothetical protein